MRSPSGLVTGISIARSCAAPIVGAHPRGDHDLATRVHAEFVRARWGRHGGYDSWATTTSKLSSSKRRSSASSPQALDIVPPLSRTRAAPVEHRIGQIDAGIRMSGNRRQLSGAHSYSSTRPPIRSAAAIGGSFRFENPAEDQS